MLHAVVTLRDFCSRCNVWLCPKCNGQQDSCQICDGQGSVTEMELYFFNRNKVIKTHKNPHNLPQEEEKLIFIKEI